MNHQERCRNQSHWRGALSATAFVAITIVTASGAAQAVQTCDTDDPCTTGICKPDGTCEHSAANEGGACDTFDPCSSNGKCRNGACVGTNLTNGTPCTSLNPCLINTVCTNGHCSINMMNYMNSFKCGLPDLENPCVANCDFLTGTCGNFESHACDDPFKCHTGTCVPDQNAEEGYTCANVQNAADNTPCNDYEECNGTQDTCQLGTCVGSGQTVETNTPTATRPTATATPTTPAATATRTSTATATVRTMKPCVGDCTGKGSVTIADIINGMRIALGLAALDTCDDLDVNHDERVTIEELVQAVHSAVDGCVPESGTPVVTPTGSGTTGPATVTQTPTSSGTAGPATPTRTRTDSPTETPGGIETPTDTPTIEETPTDTPTIEETPTDTPTNEDTPTQTPTPDIGSPSIPKRAAGMVVGTSNTLLAIPDMLSVLIGRLGGGSGGAAAAGTPFSCPGGGSVVVNCSFPSTYTLTPQNCTVNGANGQTVTLNAPDTQPITATDTTAGHICILNKPTNLAVSVPNLTVTANGTAGSITANFSNLSMNLALSNASDPTCKYRTISLQHLYGIMAVQTRDSQGATVNSTQVEFTDTNIVIDVTQYSTNCVPITYTETIDGQVTLARGEANSFTAIYTRFALANDQTSGSSQLHISGTVASTCFGADISVIIGTNADLTLPDGTPCPSAGQISVNTGDLVSYTDSGGVLIDVGGSGTNVVPFTSCLDPVLFACPAS